MITGLVPVLLLALSSVYPVAAENDGTISGQLSNASPGGETPVIAEVFLELYTPESDEPETQTSPVDDEAGFVFHNLDTNSSYTYYVGVEYLGITYYSKALSFTEENLELSAEVNVYETTDDASEISIALSHTIITVDAEGLSVTEFFILNNSGEYTYTGSDSVPVLGDEKVTALLPIPAEAEHLQLGPEMGDNALFTDSGLAYSAPIIPGYTPVTYSYHIHTSESRYSFKREVEFPQDKYEFLVQGAKNIDAPQLNQNEPLVIEEASYDYFTGSGIAAGEELVMELSGFNSGETNPVLLVFGAIILMLALFIFAVSRGKGKTGNGEEAVVSEDKLLQRIARLDDEYEDGEIAEDRYRQKREELKQAILRLRRDEGKD